MPNLKQYVRKIIPQHKNFIRQKPGFVFLCLILAVITIGIIKPGYYFLGWDNFSSYLNLKNSVLNTVFATWREHRGMGVPSDAEVNDLFRQFFFAVTSIVFPRQMLDQLYVTFMLWGGTLGMYALGKYVSTLFYKEHRGQEIFGTLAAFFYLFNLSTLAVFYFPMIMYVTRYFMLPTTVWVILNIIHERKLTRQFYLISLGVLFIGFGAYMVPTIFIVFMMALGLMLLIFRHKKRTLGVIVFFLALQSYWLLPFANYTKEKGPIVPQAPLFVNINESMLTKPASYFSFERQAKLRPGFFELTFGNNETGKSQPFHELAGFDEKGFTRMILWVFPILYLAGIVYVVAFRRKRVLIWFAAVAVTFLLLSMKEYSPVGWLYGFLSDHIPFANTVFRFGDTKFHAMIAFAGAILASVLLTDLLGKAATLKVNRNLKIGSAAVAGILLAAVYCIPYKEYFTGNFVGFFMYNKVPAPYFEIAKIINSDPDPIRVIQLPYDEQGYWKPYSWGYFGSAFLHFLFTKPIFDRTFEPASQENAGILSQVTDALHFSAGTMSPKALDYRADRLYAALKNASVRYIIDDGTISKDVSSRNISYWGVILPENTPLLLENLKNRNLVELVEDYKIFPKDYNYSALYPYNKTVPTYASQAQSIRLYKIPLPEPKISFIESVDKVNSSSGSDNRDSLSTGHSLETSHTTDSVYSLLNGISDSAAVRDGNLFWSLPVSLPKGTFILEMNEPDDQPLAQLANVYVAKTGNSLRVDVEQPVLPTVENTIEHNPRIYQTLTIPETRTDRMFLQVGDSYLPFPTDIAAETYVGSVMLHDKSTPVNVFYPAAVYDVSGSLSQTENEPQCLDDSLGDPASSTYIDHGGLRIQGQNVSTCFTTRIPLISDDKKWSEYKFYTLEFDVQGQVTPSTEKKQLDSRKPDLYTYFSQLGNPLVMHVCVKTEGSQECSNEQSLFRITDASTHVTIQVPQNYNIGTNELLSFTVRNSQKQSYTVELKNIVLRSYTHTAPQHVQSATAGLQKYVYETPGTDRLNLILPIGYSRFTNIIDLKKDGFLTVHDQNCDTPAKAQIIKENSGGIGFFSVYCRNFVNRNIPFSNSNAYFWQVTYSHLSGALPSFILMDQYQTYTLNKLVPKDVAPDDYFSVPLQRPEGIFSTVQSVKNTVAHTKDQTVSGILYPEADTTDSGNKEFIVEQYSQNEGAAIIKNMSLVELPKALISARVYPMTYQPTEYGHDARIISYDSILPDLKKVTVTAGSQGKYLLKFNEQYDRQWIIFGAHAVSHGRCDGIANCYSLELSEGKTVVYLFYLPGILYAAGIAVALTTVIIGFKLLRQKHYGRLTLTDF